MLILPMAALISGLIKLIEYFGYGLCFSVQDRVLSLQKKLFSETSILPSLKLFPAKYQGLFRRVSTLARAILIIILGLFWLLRYLMI